jgi:predicted DnaQ family exonuclease/DinG family helicase
MDKKEVFQVLGLKEYVAIDLETTGLRYNDNRITEIGIALFQNGEITETREWIVNPEQEIPDHIVRLTGITQEMVEGQPTFPEIADEILEMIKNRPIVGQNVIFDINFLEAGFRRKFRDFSGWSERYKEYHYINNIYYDTAYLSRLLFPFFERHGLQHLAKEFQYQPDAAHRALEDAKTAAYVFMRLIENLVHLTNAELEEILRILGNLKNPFSVLFENFLKFRSVIEDSDLDAYDWQHSTREQYNVLGKIFPKPIQSEPASTTLLDKEEIRKIFEPGGLLSQKLEAFESRQPQIEMVDAVVDAFNSGQILSVEAGTGTGKSYAYLVPVIKWIEKNKKRRPRIVISTNTKNLQEQLFYKDLPLLKAILDVDFSAVLLKGKANYICLDKYDSIIKHPDQRLSVHEKNQAALLVHWKHLTTTGDISEHHGFIVERNVSLWRKFIAEDKYCPGKSCKFYDDCHIMRIRQAARNADIVVVNHALLCSDLVSDNSIIGEYDFLIVDEAHNLEKVAIDYLGSAVNFWEIREALEDLYNHDKNLGLLHQIENSLRLGEVDEDEIKGTLLRFIAERKKKIQMLVVQIREEFQKFGTFFNQMMNIKVEEQNSSVTFRIKSGDQIAEYLRSMWANIRPKITTFITDLMNFSESFRNLKGKLKFQDQQYQELLAKINRLEVFRENFDFISAVEKTDYVYWVEANPTYASYDYRFFASPLRINKILYDRLFSKLEAGVLTSATITVNNRFDYFYNKLGLHYLIRERRAELFLSSPFQYEEQAALLIPLFFSSPTDPAYKNQLRDFIVKIIDAHEKGTLVLFTAYGILKSTYFSVKEDLKSKGILLLGQGIDGSRHNLIRQFKEEKSSVLFGTDSFWEGIDVPGEALEILVITRLPFEVPSDPVVEAKCELLEQEGKNPFMDYMLPESIIKLKQGFGRLIRTRTDKGIVIITDNRLMTKKYGSIIRKSLPVSARSFYEEDEFYHFIRHWFEEKMKKSKEML